MSAGTTHQTAGFITGIIATGINYLIYNHFHFFDPVHNFFIFMAIPISVIYSLLPDMDIKSNGSTLFYFIVLLITGYLIYKEMYYPACIVFAISLIPQFIPHRKFTHTILFAFLFPALPYIIFYKFNIPNEYFPLVYIPAVMGYCSHLILD